MRRYSALALAFLALSWTAAPLLACMVPGRAMTVQEHECCKHMAEMCGAKNMPQSHSCCKTEVREGGSMVATSNQQSVPVLNVVATVSVPAVLPIDHRPGIVNDHHPPGEFLPDTTVLRI